MEILTALLNLAVAIVNLITVMRSIKAARRRKRKR